VTATTGLPIMLAPVFLLFFSLGLKVGLGRRQHWHRRQETIRARQSIVSPRIQSVYDKLRPRIPRSHHMVPMVPIARIVEIDGQRRENRAHNDLCVDLIVCDANWKPYLGIVADDSRRNGQASEDTRIRGLLTRAEIPSVVVPTEGPEGTLAVEKFAQSRAS